MPSVSQGIPTNRPVKESSHFASESTNWWMFVLQGSYQFRKRIGRVCTGKTSSAANRSGSSERWWCFCNKPITSCNRATIDKWCSRRWIRNQVEMCWIVEWLARCLARFVNWGIRSYVLLGNLWSSHDTASCGAESPPVLCYKSLQWRASHAIYALNWTISHHNLLAPDLIRDSLRSSVSSGFCGSKLFPAWWSTSSNRSSQTLWILFKVGLGTALFRLNSLDSEVCEIWGYFSHLWSLKLAVPKSSNSTITLDGCFLHSSPALKSSRLFHVWDLL